MEATAVKIGIISDTHDLLRPQALATLAGVTSILHAGDICSPEVLAQLAVIAPVSAVRGNNDRGAWAQSLPRDRVVEIAGLTIYVIHDLADLAVDPRTAGFDVVVSGHSHRPL